MYSEKTAEIIDEEIRDIIEYSHHQAVQIIKDKFERLNRLAETLIEREILDGEEVKNILSDQQIQNRESN